MRSKSPNFIQESMTSTTDVDTQNEGENKGGLSAVFTALCIVDLFGVFPVVALPKSVISCGIYGIPLVVSVISLQLYTAMLLGRSWLLAQDITPHIKEKNRYPYAAVAELAFGAPGRRLVTFLINATVFCSGIPNFILASQSLQLFWWKISGGGVGVSYCIWMVLLALLLCPIMWLGSPKDMKPIALMSVFIVTTVAVATWTCILLDNVSPPSVGIMNYQPQAQDFLIAYGVLAFQFDIHPMLLTIQVDMRDGRRIQSAVLAAFCVTGTMFAVTTLLAANRYGFDVDNNILQDIPPSIPLYIVALLVTLQLCLSSAVSNSVLFQQIEDLLRIPRTFCIQRCLIRSAIVALAVFLAESVPRVDLVMGLVGSTLTGPLMFIFPPFFFLKLCYMKTKMFQKETCKYTNSFQNQKQNGVFNRHRQDGGLSKFPLIAKDAFQTKYKTFTYNDNVGSSLENEYSITCYEVLLALIVMSIGVAATFLATYSSWSNSIMYATFTPPCLINATVAARSFLQIPLTT